MKESSFHHYHHFCYHISRIPARMHFNNYTTHKSQHNYYIIIIVPYKYGFVPLIFVHFAQTLTRVSKRLLQVTPTNPWKIFGGQQQQQQHDHSQFQYQNKNKRNRQKKIDVLLHQALFKTLGLHSNSMWNRNSQPKGNSYFKQ